jgi:hypothetical protein
MGGAAALWTRLQANQKLGRPGVKATRIPGRRRFRAAVIHATRLGDLETLNL